MYKQYQKKKEVKLLIKIGAQCGNFNGFIKKIKNY